MLVLSTFQMFGAVSFSLSTNVEDFKSVSVKAVSLLNLLASIEVS